MPSPFPGMDPYLEQEILWHDFHERFLPAAAAQISAQVLPRYIVLIDEHVYLNDVDEREAFLTVCDRASRQVITVIELLSPTNKRPGPNRLRYMTKRADLLNSPAHFVEIDLLRGGPPMPAIDRPECDYSVLISRPDGRPGAGFGAIALRDPLPTVPIPLRTGEPDAHLDLRAALDRAYDEAGYRYFLYEHPPDPPLDGADAKWAELLAAQAEVDA
jgi:hypothetical protein